MSEVSSSFSVFISYAHADDNDPNVSKSYLHRCRRQLSALTRQGRVEIFTDKDIKIGQQWRDVLFNKLQNARAAVLLVGPEFFCSEFIREVEVPMLLEKVDSEGLTILLVILSPVLLDDPFKYPHPDEGPKEKSLSVFQCAHPANEPLNSMPEHAQERVFMRVAEAVRSIVDPTPTPKDVQATEADEHVKAVEGALDLLSDLVKTSDKVCRAVRKFRSTFEGASADIERLTSYKALHDLLHALQFECLDMITVDVRSKSEDLESDRLIGPEQDLQRTIEAIAAQEARWQKVQFPTVRLLDDLNIALGELKTAVEKREKRHLRRAQLFLDRVLSTNPSRINTLLLDAARRLDLPKLIETMGELQSELTRIGVIREQLTQLIDGNTSLTALDVKLRNLLYEHDKWQIADSEMRIAEANREEFVENLLISWPHVKVITEILYRENSAKIAAELESDSCRLDKALNSRDETAVRSAYRRFRRSAGIRFYQVDTELLELCSKLEEVAAPLDKMLRRLHPEL